MNLRITLTLLLPFVSQSFVGCDKNSVGNRNISNDHAKVTTVANSDLTRELAEAIIRNRIDNTLVKYITIKDSAISELKSTGRIKEWFGIYEFTDSGRDFFSSIKPSPDRIAVAPLRGVAPTWYFDIQGDVRQTLKEVSGIRTDGDNKIVECELIYHLPVDAKETLGAFIYDGLKTRAYFARYDDGWRCIELQAHYR